ncbi:XRE family transcriptional regulator [Streptomyces sp. ODS28]|uniref:helix-turn-helix domain-containing protein n=1 Tax=Streptomyces sp. ODS28 TaxID=3136688 RepID=UPI0031EB12D2
MGEQGIRGTLAGNLRAARHRRGISLSELSRKSNIGKATLSQLESGTGNPTIETVFSLSRALELPISDLLEQSVPDGVTVVRGDEAEVLSGEGVDLRPLQRVEQGGMILEVYDQRVRAGRRQESQGHVGREHTAVQAGRLHVTVGGREVELGPGDYIQFDASQPHSYAAPEDTVRSVLLLHYPAGQRDLPPHPH